MQKSNYFITLEGIEGAGKSTALKLLANILNKANKPVVETREPGGTPIAEAIRGLLLAEHVEPMCQDTELLLMFASRAQHLNTVIKPALAAGHWVLCDRFTDASYAYQGGGRGIDEQRIAMLENWVQQGLQPDLTILMDIPVELGQSRIKQRGALDRIESEQQAFFQRIRACYLARAQRYSARYRIVDARLPLLKVKKDLQRIIDELL
jgi:dTMP kinase